VQTVTTEQAIAAIDAAHAKEPGGVLAFDGDGTLWSGDIGDDYFEALLERGVHAIAHEALVREAAAEKLDTTGTSRELGLRIHRAYHAGTFPEERLCEIIAWAAAGWRRADLDSFCRDLVDALALRTRLHGEALRIIEHARRAGIPVFVVSASPRAIVEQAAKLVGIEPSHAVAVCEHFDDDVVTCAVRRPIPYKNGKVTNLRARIGAERTLYAAFGDNAFDVEMLLESRHPFAIRPKARLLERAADVPNLGVLEMITP
jgi:phosphoserine phosphatase